ncbi:MAG: hypothetical protein HY805_01015 [Nitrospirae bacterium]|nr:hypothetical protein [Nitrospirota bacterium]
MRALLDIRVRKEHGFFKVPADFESGFQLVPSPDGNLSLVFCDRNRMRRYLRHYGFVPSVLRLRK